MRRIVVTGGSGQLATAIRHAAATSRNEYLIFGREEFDICDIRSIEHGIEGADVVINCAAYTDVEGAESNTEEAMRVNDDGVRMLAEACTKQGITLIHISTDYVFGGDTERRAPYTEADTAQPINAYGRSKLAGESHIVAMRQGIVVRTSWLYSPWGNNFCKKMLHLTSERDTLRVVNDQHGTPTSALSLARALVYAIDSDAIETMHGLYHYSDEGSCTWYDFAVEIARHNASGCTIAPCTSADYPTKANRPAYSVLDTRRIYTIDGMERRRWQEALTEVISLINSKI